MKAPAAAEASGDGRVLAPFGRRSCEVTQKVVAGGYRIISALDASGPMPRAGQFYMLATARRWGDAGGRPYLPRAFSVAAAARTDGGVRLDFLSETVGPGTARLGALEPGQDLFVTGPLGQPFSSPRELSPGAAGAILVGGGIGIAPLAILRRELAAAAIPQRVLLGFRDREHSGGAEELFGSERGAQEGTGDSDGARSNLCPEVRLASDDGHVGHRGYVTDLLSVLLEGDHAESAAVYACGPPEMLEVVRSLCAERGIAAELAMETPMACGFGACFGCALPLAAGGYARLCVDGPVVRADRIETALVAGSGH